MIAHDAYLRLAVAAYLARYKGDFRNHAASDRVGDGSGGGGSGGGGFGGG